MTQKLVQSPVFADTTAIPSAAENYLIHEMPRYRECGMAMDVSSYARLLLTRTDYFEFWLRRYVGGQDRALHGMNYEIRSFLALDERCAKGMIAFSLEAVRQTILTNEWYEVMPRYLKVRQRIQKKFGIEDIPQATWQLLGYKPEFL